MFTSLRNVNHSAGTNASCRNDGHCRIKNLTKVLGISLIAILVLPSSLSSSNSLAADMIPTSIQRELQPLHNLIIRASTSLHNVTTSSITNIAESVSVPTSENTTCPSLIDVDPGSTAYNSQNIECVQQLFNSCMPSDFLLVYGLGSVHVSIKDKKDSLCSIEFRQEIEMGKSKPYSCLIPLDKIATWSSWRNADSVKLDWSYYCQSRLAG
jgi:hypothetical protein